MLAVAAQAQIPLGPYGYGGYNGLYGYNGNMAADYMYSSVDLNQDGQPDRPMMIAAAPVMSYAAAAPIAAPMMAPIAAVSPIGIRAGVAPYAAGHAVREAELLRVVNTPGHAVSYRVY